MVRTGSCGFFLSNMDTMLVRMGYTYFCKSGLMAKIFLLDSALLNIFSFKIKTDKI